MLPQRSPRLNHDQIVRICGDLLDWQTNAIIATGAGVDEL